MFAFISQPINGLTDEEIRNERDNAIRLLKERGYQIADSYFPDFNDSNIVNKPVRYLGESIKVLSTCEAIYMVPGWEKQRGCCIEYQVAKQYGIEIIYGKSPVGKE